MSISILIFKNNLRPCNILQFVWRPYLGIIIPPKLHRRLDVCDTVGLLLLFDCVEWHHVNRVIRQYGYAQSPIYQHRSSLLTSIVTLFGEYSTMIGAPYTTNGFSNGETVATLLPWIILDVPEVFNVHSSAVTLTSTSAATPIAICKPSQ
ncbi:hypothetical protein Ahy_A05g023612 isoform A [Arachis hypogaea]|uniref:Aminotransferase-like plant mobile domain-containing protein n=1 Tax=Arachis hypogaea TaxID=3818 RepID=A0A445D3Y5_ARAHY|nr:hypothetical protein Ahy_A05g023612 isoform A [Arachis hypogaea]